MPTLPPMILGLLHRLGLHKAKARSEDGYAAFTTRYDEVLPAERLPRRLGALPRKKEERFREVVRRFETGFRRERERIAVEAGRLAFDLERMLSPEERARTVVSLVIDHSGSMAGVGTVSAVLAVEGLVAALARAGVATEILGFTTADWQGGRARRAWEWAGKPTHPGRLCDLRHVVYAPVDRPTAIPEAIRYAFRPDLLRENVDGEALAWAAGRLDPARFDRRAVCVLSDGAPADESTLLANRLDRRLLLRHLEATEARLAGAGVKVGYLLLGKDHDHLPALHERGGEPEPSAVALVRLVRRLLLPATVTTTTAPDPSDGGTPDREFADMADASAQTLAAIPVPEPAPTAAARIPVGAAAAATATIVPLVPATAPEAPLHGVTIPSGPIDDPAVASIAAS